MSGGSVEGLEARWLLSAGLIGEYYGDTALTKLDLTRTDATVNFQWGTAAPNAAVPADNFSVRWVGQVSPTSSRSYTFSVMTDGGTRLYVNNQLVINHWAVSTTGQVSYASSAISLTAGHEYNLRLEFFSTTGAADIALRWQSSIMAVTVIPSTSLSTTYVDTTAPSVPTGLASSGTTATGTTLSWTPSTDDVQTTSYDVFRNGAKIGTTPTASYTDSGLTPSTSYSYTVDARDAAGNVSAPSTALVVKTTADTTPPTAPTAVHQTAATVTTVSLAWTASTDNVGVVRYDIYRAGIKVGSSTTTSYTDSSGLAPSTAYSYTVTAADAAGNISPYSTALVANTAADTVAPSTPTGLKVSNLAYNTLTLSWTASTDNVGVVSYDVFRGGLNIATVNGTSYTDTNVSGGASYTYTVDARDGAGNVSSQSTGLPVLTPLPPDTQPPSAPSNLQETAETDTTVSLQWTGSTDNVGVTGYYIYRGTTKLGPVVGTQYTDSGLTPLTTYTYTVTAIDAANNESGPSNAVPVETEQDTTAPSVPQGFSVSNLTFNSFTLSWSPSTDDVGVVSYEVYCNNQDLGPVTGTTLTETGLSPSTTYTFQVTASDQAGNASALSAPYAVQTAPPPDTQPPTAPTALTPTGATLTTLGIAWSASTDNVGVTSYSVYRGTVLAGTTAATSFTDTGLTPGTQYTYTVTAADAAGNVSMASAPLAISTVPDTQAPTTPLGLAVTSTTASTVTLGWSPSSDNVAVTGYQILYNGSSIASTAATSYTVSNLAASTSYTYTVEAYDAAGNISGPSSSITGKTTAAFNTWYVDATGATPGSTTTIAASYAKANPGDLVLIEPGTYKESLDLTRSGTATAPITLEAATTGTAILDGGSSLNTAIYGTATYINLIGLTVQHYKGTSYQNQEAAIRTASGWQLTNDLVQLNSGTGIGVFGNGISLTGVTSQNNGVNGIGGANATNVTLTNVTSQGNNTGVYFTNHDPTDEGGGGKWANCTGLTFINYHGDNNCGPGVWFDWENSNITMTNCEASGNHGGGPTNAPDWVGAPVMIEANYGPVTVTNFNASVTNSGGFSIFETPNVSVTQSTLMSGLAFRTLNRGVAALVDNNDVITHNTIDFVDLDGNAPTNLTLDYNNYVEVAGYAFFFWTNNSSYTTLAAVQAATGFELHGTLVYVTSYS